MKKLYLILGAFVLFFIFSCKKSSSSGNNTLASTSYLSSATSYSSQARYIDSFTYDSSHRLARFAQYAYDTTSGTPQYNYLTVDFVLPSNGSAPLSYVYNDLPSGITNDLHELTYDGQGRIIKDTSVSGSGFVTYFSYPNNNIASTVLFDGTRLNNQIDTLFMTNGNTVWQHVYYPNNAGTADSLEGDLQLGYSAIANPAYHPAIANSIGPLLFILQFDGFANFVDFSSKNAVNKVISVANGLPSGPSVNYNLTTDSKGILAQMSLSLGGYSSTIRFNYY